MKKKKPFRKKTQKIQINSVINYFKITFTQKFLIYSTNNYKETLNFEKDFFF